MAPVESTSCEISNQSTVSVRVPAVCVAIFSIYTTAPADVRVPPAVCCLFVLLKCARL